MIKSAIVTCLIPFPWCQHVINSISTRSMTGNVLLLRNQLTLISDWVEVSQEKLLSLVAERLIDANSNVNMQAM
nr:protein FAM63B [Tanacetum cinerariifolium]